MSTEHQERVDCRTKFSVSICVYKNDDPDHFDQALKSIVNQTVKPDEIVLVVDGPIPEALDQVIKSNESEAVFKIIRLPENVGHGNARRVGLEHCAYDLVALMDADDISVSDRFEKQIKCFNDDPELSIVGGYIEEFIGTTDNIAGVRAVPLEDEAIKEYLKKRCPFNQVTVMFKKSEVNAAGGYIDWYCEEDYYLWIRMFQNNAYFMNLCDVLVFVRVGKDMYKRRGGWKYFLSEARLQKYMRANNIIDYRTCVYNVLIRFIVQVLMPNGLRGIVFKKFARTKMIKQD